jgi:16S rRNA (uracil1498-N3)-methyltransferase
MVQLPLTEALHASRTLRMKEGDVLEICDGCGGVAAAEWLNLQNKNGSLVRIISEVSIAPREPWEWTVAVACGSLKGGRGDWLVEKAAELGATTLLPLLTTRSPTIAGSDRNDSLQRGGSKAGKSTKKRKGEDNDNDAGKDDSAAAVGGREGRWHRVALSAMKQCLRSRAMEIKAPCTVQELCSNYLSIDNINNEIAVSGVGGERKSKMTLAWVGTEGAPPIKTRARDLINSLNQQNNGDISMQKPRQGVLIIGPEGDFTADELEILAVAGVQGVGLGPLRLRTETAAIAMLSYARLLTDTDSFGNL